MSSGFDRDALLRHRVEHDRFLKEHYASPLPEAARPGFSGLDFYPLDPAWVVTASVTDTPARPIAITSSSGAVSHYRAVATVAMALGGRSYDLVVLDSGDGGRFIPFRDATNGDTTYAGGRYLDVSEGAAVLDFNRAANPWCVYDEEFSCPLPPAENTIALRVEAGEKVWRPEG